MNENKKDQQVPVLQDPLLRISQVAAALNLSRAHIYLLIKQGRFPAPVKIGPKTACYRRSTIEGWVKEKELGVAK